MPWRGCRMVINSNPDEDIHLQLVWDTPGDADQTDLDGSDVDLHFCTPVGSIGSVMVVNMIAFWQPDT